MARFGLCLTLILAGGCGVDATPAPLLPSTATLNSGTFIPYLSVTPRPSLARTPEGLAVLPTATPQPAPTPTPRTHVVKAGEDMGGIALRYRVPLKDLLAANPTVNPRLMLVGTVLIIPGVAAQPSPEARPSATSQPVRFEAPRCLENPGGGSWCFMKVFNAGATALINVTVQLRLVDAAGTEVARQTASLPFDLLPVGGMLPLVAYFSMPLPAGAQVGTQLISALPASATSEHYAEIRLKHPSVEIAADGVTAVAVGQVELVDARARPAQWFVLAVAYDESDHVVAVRQWQGSNTLQGGQTADFQVQIYALGGAIRRVELLTEARN